MQKQQDVIIIGDEKSIGKVPYPDPYWSTPVQSARFSISVNTSGNGVTKAFQGGRDVFTLEKCYDPRIRNIPKYWDTDTRRVDNWRFTAVRTIDPSGSDRSTVYISGSSLNTWNIIRLRDNVLMSRNGFEVDFAVSHHVLHTFVTGRNFQGNVNRCRQTADTMTINPFDIPNSVFEAFDNVVIRGKAEMYYGCP